MSADVTNFRWINNHWEVVVDGTDMFGMRYTATYFFKTEEGAKDFITSLTAREKEQNAT